MKTIETHQWRICHRAGRRLVWTQTVYHATEAEIRVRHSMAQRVDGTMRLREVPAKLAA